MTATKTKTDEFKRMATDFLVGLRYPGQTGREQEGLSRGLAWSATRAETYRSALDELSREQIKLLYNSAHEEQERQRKPRTP